jgi:hypothetical protein
MKALVKLATLAFLTAALTGCWAKVSEELGEDPSTKIETDEQRKVPDIVNGETQEVAIFCADRLQRGTVEPHSFKSLDS